MTSTGTVGRPASMAPRVRRLPRRTRTAPSAVRTATIGTKTLRSLMLATKAGSRRTSRRDRMGAALAQRGNLQSPGERGKHGSLSRTEGARDDEERPGRSCAASAALRPTATFRPAAGVERQLCFCVCSCGAATRMPQGCCGRARAPGSPRVRWPLAGEYREHLRWRGDRNGCRPGRRYVRHARGSLPGGDHRFSCPPPPARAYGPALLFLVAAWTWPARAHVRTCRARAERSRLSLRTPGTASKGVTGIAWPGAARETGGGARNDRAGHAARASR